MELEWRDPPPRGCRAFGTPGNRKNLGSEKVERQSSRGRESAAREEKVTAHENAARN